LAGLLILAVTATTTRAQEETAEAADDTTVVADPPAEVEKASGIPEGVNCGDGLLIPIWRPYDNLGSGDRFGRGILYGLLMIWLFIGVAIVSDKFMESIETITAQEKEVTIKDPRTGKNQIVVVKVWNETVANLTLMALGSSAPEIMLSVIEIWAKGFEAGDLGPGTIVGSAAFNLFMIIGLCMYVIPDDEVRKIKHLRVFIITATWSVFAYVWLYLILAQISKGKVESWEGILTFLFFPATVYTADDHGGVFQFEEHEAEITESVGTFELKVARQSGARGTVAIPFTTEEGTAKAGKDYEHVEGELLFNNEENAKTIEIPISEEDSYEKNVVMYVVIGEPRHISGPPGEGEGVDYAELDGKKPEDLTEEEKIALLGRPRLGDVTKIQIRIRESKEFKSSVDRMMQRGNASMMAGASSWKDQILEAFTVQAGDDDEEEEEEGGDEDAEKEEKMPTCGDYIMHFLTLFWKVIFSFIPPAGIANGYPCFVISIAMIGFCTAVIGDVAGHLGCFIFLKDSVNAIAFVALGTSVPDTFASKTAAIQDETADASVGNVTGSNAVNVFLGIGIAWSMAAIYHESQGRTFNVEAGSLGFSVTIFCIEAVLAIGILMLRRNPAVGGELGGPKNAKTISAGIFVFFWCFYVFMSALEAYKVIRPGF